MNAWHGSHYTNYPLPTSSAEQDHKHWALRVKMRGTSPSLPYESTIIICNPRTNCGGFVNKCSLHISCINLLIYLYYLPVHEHIRVFAHFIL